VSTAQEITEEKKKPGIDIEKMLKLIVEKGASDLFITAGAPPSMKLNGKMAPIVSTALSPELTRETVLGVMNETQRRDFLRDKELNFAISARGIGRFRVSAFYQRNLCGMVLRRIETRIPTTEELGLPEIIKELAMTKRGLVIFVGATGAGKSTSLAAMIGYRNRNSKGHIISVEDPIEYIHQHDGCIITQREVGIDTESFEVALKNMLRQAPDVILIGEVRTRETMEHAITFAETGHLCLCTLHANNANQALDRILHFFPSDRHPQLFMDLSLNLKGMVAQQLIPTPDGKGRRACVEILVNSPLASDLIRKGEIHTLKDLMARSNELGMQTFDQHLYELYSAGEITYEDAIAHADSANDLRLMIKLGADNDPSKLGTAASGLSLEHETADNKGRSY
jgi:twitching motility protein PilU